MKVKKRSKYEISVENEEDFLHSKNYENNEDYCNNCQTKCFFRTDVYIKT